MIRIGTRSSPLALIQASLVRDALAQAHPHKQIEIIPFTTRGDRTLRSLHDIGGKALFTKELQDALLMNTIDAAVHSLKDVELHNLPLTLGAYLPREAPHDVLITRKNNDALIFLGDQKVQGSSDQAGEKVNNPRVFNNQSFPKELSGILGSCSPRRCAQAKLTWPDITIVDLRGNVGTRLQHMVDGKIDATILAAAGLIRLGLIGHAFEERYPTLQQSVLPIETFIPAAGQGVIAIECRPEDAGLFAPISDVNTQYCAQLERQFSKHLGGSCRTALGAHVRFAEGSLKINNESIDATKLIEILAFFEGRTLGRMFPATGDLSEAIHDMANALKE
ncbi:MAG: hydroxymethylbilane synthase [Pseudomonadota bacterium]